MIRRTTLYLAALLLLGIGTISPAANATPPTPISCTTGTYTITAPGNYIVTANLTTTGICILIEASDVAIDLQGHSITGTPTGFGISAYDSSFTPYPEKNISITNGTIKGFYIGIALGADTYVTISNINAMQNLYAGIGLDSNSKVHNSQANNNGSYGIACGGDYNTVNNSPANNNGLDGISFGAVPGEGNYNTVSHSPANNNGMYGIGFNGGHNTVINSPANNNMYGIGLGEGNNTIINSQANGNTAYGIGIAAGGNNIFNSQANGNTAYGIAIDGDNNLLTSDTANDNVGVGIALTCPSYLFGDTAKGDGTNTTFAGTGCVEFDNNF
jgi:hypothetical protein